MSGKSEKEVKFLKNLKRLFKKFANGTNDKHSEPPQQSLDFSMLV